MSIPLDSNHVDVNGADGNGHASSNGAQAAISAAGPDAPPPHIAAPDQPPAAILQATPGFTAGGPHPLVVLVGDDRRDINPALLEDHVYAEQQREALSATEDQPVFDITHLLNWTDEQRGAVMLFIAQFEGCTVRGGDVSGSLFNVALAAMEGPADVERCGRGVKAAVLAAALVHADALPAACTRIEQRLKELKVKGYTTAKLRKEAEQVVGAVRLAASDDVDPDPSTSVRQILDGAPVADDIVVPPGWELSAAGIARRCQEESIEVIPAPMLITKRLMGIGDQQQHAEVAWFLDDRWHREIVLRTVIADSRKIIQLAGKGAPVNSNNASDTVAYLADFESVNLEVLPRSNVTDQLGWQGPDGSLGFLWGQELVRGDTVAEPQRMDQPQAAEPIPLVFRGPDEGNDQLAGAYCSAGSFDDWCSTVRPLAEFPRVQLAIYGALAPPLLSILSAQNFILSFAGATSMGKTITLRVAASVWGKPDERSASATLGTWDATTVYIERAAQTLTDLPFIMDDTKRARKKDLVSRTIYDVTSGRCRGRGSVDGIRRTSAFRTVMITSGESPITSFSEDGGTRARTLECWGSPFDRTDAETAQLVNAVNEGVLANYGHLGPRFVRYVVDNRDKWDEWRSTYSSLRGECVRLAGGNSAAMRMVAHLATVQISAMLVHQAIPELPWDNRNVVVELWDELTSESEDADRAAAALRHVMSWARSNRERFGLSRTGGLAHGALTGRWSLEDAAGGSRDGFLGIFPHVLDEALQAGGHDPTTIRRLWNDRGWLRTSTGRGDRYRTRVGGALGDVVAIKQDAIEQVEGPLVAEEGDTAARPIAAEAQQGENGITRGGEEQGNR